MPPGLPWLRSFRTSSSPGALGERGAGLNADDPINTFTLMKVIGRDIWIGIWCLIFSVVSVVFWERGGERAVGAGIIWQRFPKFVLGFFAASAIMSVVAARVPADHRGVAKLTDTFKSGAETIPYRRISPATKCPASSRIDSSMMLSRKPSAFSAK